MLTMDHSVRVWEPPHPELIFLCPALMTEPGKRNSSEGLGIFTEDLLEHQGTLRESLCGSKGMAYTFQLTQSNFPLHAH